MKSKTIEEVLIFLNEALLERKENIIDDKAEGGDCNSYYRGLLEGELQAFLSLKRFIEDEDEGKE